MISDFRNFGLMLFGSLFLWLFKGVTIRYSLRFLWSYLFCLFLLFLFLCSLGLRRPIHFLFFSPLIYAALATALFPFPLDIMFTEKWKLYAIFYHFLSCLLYTSPSPRDRQKSRMPSSAWKKKKKNKKKKKKKIFFFFFF